MGKCPREHCHGDTYLVADRGNWFEECMLCNRRFPVNPPPNFDHKRYEDIPAFSESPFSVRYKLAKSYSGRKEE